MLISSTKEAHSRVIRGHELKRDLCSFWELTGSVESQEISREIIWPLDFCCSGRHQSCVVVGHFGAGSLYQGRKPGMLRKYSVSALSTTAKVHASIPGEGRIRMHVKKHFWVTFVWDCRWPRVMGRTQSLCLLRAKPSPSLEMRSDMSRAQSLSELRSMVRQEHTGWRMKRTWLLVLSRNRFHIFSNGSGSQVQHTPKVRAWGLVIGSACLLWEEKGWQVPRCWCWWLRQGLSFLQPEQGLRWWAWQRLTTKRLGTLMHSTFSEGWHKPTPSNNILSVSLAEVSNPSLVLMLITTRMRIQNFRFYVAENAGDFFP